TARLTGARGREVGIDEKGKPDGGGRRLCRPSLRERGGREKGYDERQRTPHASLDTQGKANRAARRSTMNRARRQPLQPRGRSPRVLGKQHSRHVSGGAPSD